MRPIRFVRPPDRPASELATIIAALSEAEKRIVLGDRSADGWSYADQFAQHVPFDEALVRGALPASPDAAGAVAAFLAKFNR